MIGGEHLIAFLELEGTDDEIDAPGGVHDINDRVWRAVEVGADLLANGREPAIDLTAEELHRLAFELSLPALISVEDWDRTCAEGAMIEEGHLRIEEEQLFQRIGGHGQPKPRETRMDASTIYRWTPTGLAFGRSIQGSCKQFPGMEQQLNELRWALVTGVGRQVGIGAAICRALAADGVSICFAGWTNYDAEIYGGEHRRWHESFAAELEALGVEAAGFEVDLSEPAAIVGLMDRVRERTGMLSILVNNAAFSTNGDIDALTAKQLDDHYAVNVRGMALLTQAFVRQWTGDSGGRVVNMTSGQGQGPMPGELAYAASKGAVEAFTTSVAPTLAERGITINAVNPGPTDTGWMSDELKEILLPQFPMGRIGGPDDAARLVAFLCSEHAGWITGQVMNSEGGFWRK